MCVMFFFSTSAQVALKLKLPYAKKLLKAPGQTAKVSIKAAQKAAMMLKRAAQAAIKFAKVVIKATVEAVKATIAILKETIAIIIAGGWVAVLIIIFEGAESKWSAPYPFGIGRRL